MRSRFDPLYSLFGAIGAFFIVLTLLIQVVSIFGRFVDFTIDGYDAYAGYFLAAGSFFAMAHTLRRGDHIRVTLLVNRFTGKARVRLEAFCLVVATLLSAYFAWFSIKLAYGSWAFNDISQNIDATPLWIPQISMALGMLALFVAFAEELVHVVRHGALPPPQSGELARTE
jgi:TRAP-type C4-dicarboxylate transport system permease small subunit